MEKPTAAKLSVFFVLGHDIKLTGSIPHICSVAWHATEVIIVG